MHLLSLYFTFFKLGLFSFGGGYVMLPLLYQQIETQGLIPIAEFADILAISQLTPGPIAINAATYIGFRNAGLSGAMFATLGVITPSILLTVLMVVVVHKCKESLLLKSILDGVKPVTVGMIAVAGLYFLEMTIFNGKLLSLDVFKMGKDFINLYPLMLFAVITFLAVKTRISPIILSISAGLIGMLII